MRDVLTERPETVTISAAAAPVQVTPVGYRGPDRRARSVVDGPPPTALAAAALVLGALIPLGLVDTPSWLDPGGVTTATTVLDAMALGFALLGVVVLVQRTKLGGDGWARRLATVLLVLAVAVIAFELTSTAASWSGAVVPVVGRVVLLVAAAELLVAAAVDTARRAWWLNVVVSCSTVGVLVGVVALAPALGEWVQAGTGPLPRPALAVTGAGALAIALLAFAIAVRRNDVRARWVVMLFIALAASDFALAVEAGIGSLSTLVAGVIRLAGVVTVLYLSLVELRNVAIVERERTVEARLEAARAADRLVNHVRRQEEVVHDARNALLAIDGGLASVSGERSEVMVAALRSEVHRLSSVLEHERQEAPQPFGVVDLLEPMILLYAAAELPVRLVSVGHPWAMGDPADLVEVVQNLIDNALRHAPDSPVTVWVAPAGAEVQIRVADRGPGVNPADRGRIFERGVSSTQSGIGLSVARELVRAQGGTISVSDRDGGGALFAVHLPRFDVDDPDEERPRS